VRAVVPAGPSSVPLAGLNQTVEGRSACLGSREESCCMQRFRDRLPGVAAARLAAATILFVVGITIERSQARAGEQQAASMGERPAGEAGEHSEAEATEGGSNPTSEATEEHSSAGESGEELLGIKPESAGLSAVVAAAALLLAALLVARPRRGLLVAVVVVGLVSAALDVVRASTRPANPTRAYW